MMTFLFAAYESWSCLNEAFNTILVQLFYFEMLVKTKENFTFNNYTILQV